MKALKNPVIKGTALGLSLLGSLATSAALEADRERDLAVALGEKLLAPAYERFAASSQALALNVERYCSGQSTDLDAPRSAYRTALHDWMYLQPVNWGPAAGNNRHPALYFWPDKKDIGSRQLRTLIADADPATLERGYFDGASIAVSGLSALERLLFDDEPLPPQAFRCDTAAAIAANSAHMARSLSDDWPPYLQQWRQAEDPLAGLRLLVKSMDEIAQIISQQKIAMPLGSAPDRARARRAESWRSGQSLANIHVNLDFIEAMLEGDERQPGMLALIADVDSSLAEILRAQLFATDSLLENIDQSLEDAVEDRSGRGKLMMLQANIDALQQLLANDVSGALGITLGFNSRDGD